MRAHDEQVRAKFALQRTYAVADWAGPKMIDEWSLGNGTYRSLRFSGPDGVGIVVATTDDADDDPVRHLVMNLPATDRDRFADGSVTHALYNAPRIATTTLMLGVSGRPVPFSIWEIDDFVIAGAVIRPVGVGVRTNGSLDALSLKLVDDIEPYIQGRNDHIRTLRADRGLDD